MTLIEQETMQMNSAFSQQALRHLGMIPDGVRRWAREHGVSYDNAYLKAADRLVSLTDVVFQQGVESFSVYTLSRENLARSDDVLAAVLRAEKRLFDSLLVDAVKTWRCKVIHAGLPLILPESLQRALQALCESTCHYGERRLYLCVGYDPLDEAIQAIDRTPSVSRFTDFLWVPEKLDFVIRTSGELRLSNFLPLQSAYAELYFSPKYFPDFTQEDLERAFEDFYMRSRRFGR